MYIEKQIDDLIETGLSHIDARFDPVAFQLWRKRCVSCLSVLLGPDHICTRFFRRHLQGASRNNFVVGVGILAVVNHESKKTCREEKSDHESVLLTGHRIQLGSQYSLEGLKSQ